ncbi:hypothetical protein QMG83_01500 [Salinibacterium sp. G-O1]|uniref:hypothetical protein n=1 Tax=Salinibacterium sp. G-O1 TaxID=3046208 RepID=UPI0024B88EA5|nr:hypothetical protein [Salinibacterium sp. G-O1]MDJ0333893.1 hypothetical protein [Salinibacterium sp. G-O1]
MLLKNAESRRIAICELSQHAVPVVIATAIESGDPELSAEARAFMNELGESGSFGHAKEVQAVLEGALSEADVID